MKFNSKLIILYALILFTLVIGMCNGNINFELLDNNQFNLITVSTVFAGFLFTSLGIVAGLYSNSTLKKFERISTMDKIYGNIILGIIFSLISVIISLLIICIKVTNDTSITTIVHKLANIVQIYFLFLTILQFVISVKCTYFAIKVVRYDIKKNLPSKTEMDEILSKIK
ncbi:hypothetical protein FDA52_01575 [Clostridium botulinum]|nr:hypothetical protein [Clostridium botulinum]